MLYKSKRQASVIFVADEHSSRVLQPNLGAFDSQLATLPMPLADVLQRPTVPVLALRTDQVDGPPRHALMKTVPVGRAIINLSLATQAMVLQQRFNQGGLGGIFALDLHGRRLSCASDMTIIWYLGSLALVLPISAFSFFFLPDVPSEIASST